jgi:hypothetical protein
MIRGMSETTNPETRPWSRFKDAEPVDAGWYELRVSPPQWTNETGAAPDQQPKEERAYLFRGAGETIGTRWHVRRPGWLMARSLAEIDCYPEEATWRLALEDVEAPSWPSDRTWIRFGDRQPPQNGCYEVMWSHLQDPTDMEARRVWLRETDLADLGQRWIVRFSSDGEERRLSDVDADPADVRWRPITASSPVQAPRMSARRDAVERMLVVQLIAEHGLLPDVEHKQWILDQVMRLMLGDEYQGWLELYEQGAGVPWPRGIEPGAPPSNESAGSQAAEMQGEPQAVEQVSFDAAIDRGIELLQQELDQVACIEGVILELVQVLSRRAGAALVTSYGDNDPRIDLDRFVKMRGEKLMRICRRRSRRDGSLFYTVSRRGFQSETIHDAETMRRIVNQVLSMPVASALISKLSRKKEAIIAAFESGTPEQGNQIPPAGAPANQVSITCRQAQRVDRVLLVNVSANGADGLDMVGDDTPIEELPEMQRLRAETGDVFIDSLVEQGLTEPATAKLLVCVVLGSQTRIVSSDDARTRHFHGSPYDDLCRAHVGFSDTGLWVVQIRLLERAEDVSVRRRATAGEATRFAAGANPFVPVPSLDEAPLAAAPTGGVDSPFPVVPPASWSERARWLDLVSKCRDPLEWKAVVRAAADQDPDVVLVQAGRDAAGYYGTYSAAAAQLMADAPRAVLALLNALLEAEEKLQRSRDSAGTACEALDRILVDASGLALHGLTVSIDEVRQALARGNSLSLELVPDDPDEREAIENAFISSLWNRYASHMPVGSMDELIEEMVGRGCTQGRRQALDEIWLCSGPKTGERASSAPEVGHALIDIGRERALHDLLDRAGVDVQGDTMTEDVVFKALGLPQFMFSKLIPHHAAPAAASDTNDSADTHQGQQPITNLVELRSHLALQIADPMLELLQGRGGAVERLGKVLRRMAENQLLELTPKHYDDAIQEGVLDLALDGETIEGRHRTIVTRSMRLMFFMYDRSESIVSQYQDLVRWMAVLIQPKDTTAVTYVANRGGNELLVMLGRLATETMEIREKVTGREVAADLTELMAWCRDSWPALTAVGRAPTDADWATYLSKLPAPRGPISTRAVLMAGGLLAHHILARSTPEITNGAYRRFLAELRAHEQSGAATA